jgi:membrane-associated PAP2 superfamily phosphatase
MKEWEGYIANLNNDELRKGSIAAELCLLLYLVYHLLVCVCVRAFTYVHLYLHMHAVLVSVLLLWRDTMTTPAHTMERI